MSKTPGFDQMRTAAEWLDNYEETDDRDEGAEACRAVKDWLLNQAEAAELRAACRESGVPVAKARAALAAQRKEYMNRPVTDHGSQPRKQNWRGMPLSMPRKSDDQQIQPPHNQSTAS